MGTPDALRVTLGPDSNEPVIIAFDGVVSPNVHCDESMAIVQRPLDKTWSTIPLKHHISHVSNWHDARELDKLRQEGRITLLPVPQTSFPDAVVLYASKTILEEADLSEDISYRGQTLNWLQLENTNPSVRVCCIPRPLALSLLNDLCLRFLNRMDQHLILAQQEGRTPFDQVFQQLANFGLDVARGHSAHEKVYLRIGTAHFFADGLEQLLKLLPVVEIKCPLWTKDTFLNHVTTYAHLIRSAASFKNSVEFSEGIVSQGVLDSLATKAILYAEIVRTQVKEQNSYEPAFEAAVRFRGVVPASLQFQDQGVEDFLNYKSRAYSDHFYISSEDILMLALKPMFYYPEITTRRGPRTLLHARKVREALREMGQASWPSESSSGGATACGAITGNPYE